MKLIIKLSLLIFVLPNILALEITEAESNPLGADSGNEWVELYSEQEINLEDYYLENNDGKVYNLSGNFAFYFIIKFSSQWLDNSDEKVILKKDDEIIDETILLDDGKNSDLSWSKCSDRWIFAESTEKAENNCVEEKSSQTEETSEKSTESNSSKKTNQILEQINKPENKNSEAISDADEKITLNSPAKQSSQEFTAKQEKNRIGIVYAFTIFAVIIIILLALRKL